MSAKKFLFPVIALASAVPFGAGAVDMSIDDFSCSKQIVTVQGGASGFSNAAAACAIGGWRYITADNNNAAGTTVSTVSSADTDFLELSFSNAANAFGSGYVLWDANGAGLGSDFSAFAGIGYEYRNDNGGHVAPALNVTWTIIDGNSASGSVNYLLGNSQGWIGAFVPFASFGALDFTNITSIKLAFASASNGDGFYDDVDARFRLIEVVPEPGSMMLLGLGLIAMGVGLRRKV